MIAGARGPAGRRPGAAPLYLVLEGSLGFFFSLAFTVNLVYQYTVVGLNPLQLVLVGTVLEGTAFLCEIPTGLVADTYSRRLSIVIGCVLLGLSLDPARGDPDLRRDPPLPGGQRRGLHLPQRRDRGVARRRGR